MQSASSHGGMHVNKNTWISQESHAFTKMIRLNLRWIEFKGVRCKVQKIGEKIRDQLSATIHSLPTETTEGATVDGWKSSLGKRSLNVLKRVYTSFSSKIHIDILNMLYIEIYFKIECISSIFLENINDTENLFKKRRSLNISDLNILNLYTIFLSQEIQM